jgi:hypothetical protein
MIGLASFTEGWGKMPELSKFVSLLLHSSDRVIIPLCLFILVFKNFVGDEVELRVK